jgi:hypothetical protein
MKKFSALFLALIAQSAFAQTATPESTAAQLLDPAKVAEVAQGSQGCRCRDDQSDGPGHRHHHDAEGHGSRHLHQDGPGQHGPRHPESLRRLPRPQHVHQVAGRFLDPNFYTAALAPLLNPNMYMKWLSAPLDPRVLQMMMAPLNPNMYTNWALAPLAPANVNMMMAPLNPNLYTNWAGAAANPATYGTWGSLMNPATYGNIANPFAGFIPVPAAK